MGAVGVGQRGVQGVRDAHRAITLNPGCCEIGARCSGAVVAIQVDCRWRGAEELDHESVGAAACYDDVRAGDIVKGHVCRCPCNIDVFSAVQHDTVAAIRAHPANVAGVVEVSPGRVEDHEKGFIDASIDRAVKGISCGGQSGAGRSGDMGSPGAVDSDLLGRIVLVPPQVGCVNLRIRAGLSGVELHQEAFVAA